MTKENGTGLQKAGRTRVWVRLAHGVMIPGNKWFLREKALAGNPPDLRMSPRHIILSDESTRIVVLSNCNWNNLDWMVKSGGYKISDIVAKWLASPHPISLAVTLEIWIDCAIEAYVRKRDNLANENFPRPRHDSFWKR